MVLASGDGAGPSPAVELVQAANAYMADVKPAVTDALGDAYARWRTN